MKRGLEKGNRGGSQNNFSEGPFDLVLKAQQMAEQGEEERTSHTKTEKGKTTWHLGVAQVIEYHQRERGESQG